MNIIELTIIGNQKTEKEKLFSQLSENPLRNFKGLKFGYLNLDEENTIHFYFLDQEKESFLYLWDLIIPHSLGIIVICDCNEPQILNESLAVIERLNKVYSTPYFICPLAKNEEVIQQLENLGVDTKDGNRILNFDENDNQSAKKLLIEVFSILTNE